MSDPAAAAATTVCDAKGYFKPFRYPFAFEAYQMQNKMHWSPEEVPLARARTRATSP